MTNQEIFLKDLSDYLDIELSEYDCKRIGGYLDEYVAKLPLVKEPPTVIISAPKVIYRYIGNGNSDTRRVVNVDDQQKIIDLVASFTGVNEKAMKGKDRYSRIVFARHIAMFYINKYCNETLVQTGKIFNRDHTSVLSAVKNVRSKIDTGCYDHIEIIERITKELSIPLEKTA